MTDNGVEQVARHCSVRRIFDGYADQVRFHPIRPEAILCDTFIRQRCAAQLRTVFFIYDDGHVFDTGARLIVAAIMQQARPGQGRNHDGRIVIRRDQAARPYYNSGREGSSNPFAG